MHSTLIPQGRAGTHSLAQACLRRSRTGATSLIHAAGKAPASATITSDAFSLIMYRGDDEETRYAGKYRGIDDTQALTAKDAKAAVDHRHGVARRPHATAARGVVAPGIVTDEGFDGLAPGNLAPR